METNLPAFPFDGNDNIDEVADLVLAIIARQAIIFGRFVPRPKVVKV